MPTKRTKRAAHDRKRFHSAVAPPLSPKSALASPTPYGLPAADLDLNRNPAYREFFSGLDARARESFAALACVSAHPEGALLFVEGQESRGVFVVLEGKVKLSITSREGKTLIWKLAGPGSFLGLVTDDHDLGQGSTAYV